MEKAYLLVTHRHNAQTESGHSLSKEDKKQESLGLDQEELLSVWKELCEIRLEEQHSRTVGDKTVWKTVILTKRSHFI